MNALLNENESENEPLVAAVERLFSDISGAAVAEQSPSQESAWSQVEEVGIASVLVPESAGGFGGSWRDACSVLRRAGRHGIALPIADTLMVRGLLARAGAHVPPGAASLADSADVSLSRVAPNEAWQMSGFLHAVPWGASVDHVLVATSDGKKSVFALVATAAGTVAKGGTNLAGERRDELYFDRAPLVAVVSADTAPADLRGIGALMRVAQIAGALECITDLTIQHTSQRTQFGRTLTQFQVIQHQLAQLAEESAAVGCAALAAFHAADMGDATFEAAAAKLRANRAIGTATSVAHQLHGAIGITREHALPRVTQRLWSWRSEFGNDRCWALRLGASVVERGADALWSTLTERGDRIQKEA
jgi:acyl-CoA dehydrogenase